MIIALSIVLLLYVWQIYRQINAWEALSPSTAHDPPSVAPSTPPSCTILVAARNEQENLEKLIPDLKAQQYPARLEIVIVDDGSTDGSRKWLEEQKDINVVLLDEELGRTGKKAAISLGVEKAEAELILQTDADCMVGPEWASLMLSGIESGNRLVFGPVQYRSKPGLLNGLMELEMCCLSALCGSGLYLKEPFLSNAANMAYYRSDFLAWDPYGGSRFSSGDDIELMQKAMKTGAGCTYIQDPLAIVHTQAPSSLREFIGQRLRWASKTRIGHIPFPAMVFFGMNVLLFIGSIVGSIGYPIWLGLLWIWIGKWLADLFFFHKILPFFHGKKMDVRWYLISFILVLIYPFYVTLFAIFSKFVPYRWKDRKIAN
ncbi:MAG: glycosyltransferase [Flavobacteriales bacterium]|nr:glycosyltransferase [Flavobacteriales bacterium]